MTRATSEQKQEVRRRRRWMWIGVMVFFAIFGVGSIVVEHVVGSGAATAFIALTWLLGGCGLLIFLITYWRCPSCKHYFERGSEGRVCRNCQTTFED